MLELGDRIGYVNTGLKEDMIVQCLRKTKLSDNLFSPLPTEMERKCSICQVGSSTILISGFYYQDSTLNRIYVLSLWSLGCIYVSFRVYPMQEDYEGNDEVGKLECGHFYHIYCIKQWLMQKSTCPICKTTAASE